MAPAGNGRNVVKQHLLTRAAIQEERRQRMELQLLEYQRSATLSFLSTKDRTIAAKMLVVEAHRYQRVLYEHHVTKADGGEAPVHEATQHSMTAQRYVRDVLDDIGVLMARMPKTPSKGGAVHQKTALRRQSSTFLSPFRPTRDNYLFVKTELAGLELWRFYQPSGPGDQKRGEVAATASANFEESVTSPKM